MTVPDGYDPNVNTGYFVTLLDGTHIDASAISNEDYLNSSSGYIFGL